MSGPDFVRVGGTSSAPEPRTAPPRERGGFRRWLPVLLVALVSSLVYVNTLSCGFTWDDQWLILDNPRIQDPKYIKELLLNPTLWRPIKRISLMADYAIWGPERPGGFHASNVLFQTCACLALFAFVRKLGGGRRLATVTALLFAVHPLHVEAIANISHRKEPLALLFYLLAFNAYLSARAPVPGRAPFAWASRAIGLVKGDAADTFARMELLCWTLLFYLCGMLSKEVGAVMFPATLLVYELAVAPGPPRERARWAGLTLAPVLPVLILFTVRGHIGRLHKYKFSEDQIRWITGDRTASYLTVLQGAIKAWAEYIHLLLWPSPLYLDRAFELPGSVRDPGVLAGLALLALWAFGLAFTWQRSRLGFFALAWYAINFLPISNVVPLTHWLVAERFAYVPSVGFALLVALALEALWERRLRLLPAASQPRIADALVAILIVVHAGLTYRQNAIWKNSTTLWGQTLKYNPKSYRGLYGFGLELANAGKTAEAEDYYRRAIAVERSYPEPHYALALLQLNLGRFDEAIEEATIHARLAEEDPEPFMVIGNARFGKGDYAGAADAYREAVKRDEDHVDARYNLANALYGAQRFPEALTEVEKALGRKNASIDLFILRGSIQEALGAYDDALGSYVEASAADPRSPEPLSAAGFVLMRLGRNDEAVHYLERALALDPGQARVKQTLERLQTRGQSTVPGR